jgi:hypothetical protein
MMTRKNMFLAMLILFIVAFVATISDSFVSKIVSDLAFYGSIASGLVWLAMLLTGKGKESSE